MAQFDKALTLPFSGDPLEVVVALLKCRREEDYFAYEHGDTWFIGLRSYASLIIEPDGKTAVRVDQNGRRESYLVNAHLNDIARAFNLEYSTHGKVFGQVGFNYSAHIAGQAYIPGQWPILSLMAPCVQVAVSPESIIVTGAMKDEAKVVFGLIQNYIVGLGRTNGFIPSGYPSINLQSDSYDYKARVARAVSDIKKGKYTKAIPSRMVCLSRRVDMLATLLHGRRANTPARTFTFNHMGFQATGFSPEVVLSVNNQLVFTEALAGTQISHGACSQLQDDPKEVMEHTIAVRGSIRRLKHICFPDSVVIKDFLTTITRGNVNHLYSRIMGHISPGKDGWDSIRSNITVPALPRERNMEAIDAFEPYPRELFCGSVLMLDGPRFFEATLALRTVFQDQHRQWLQAGAGITALSDPEREFTETCEKLGSVAPYVVAEAGERITALSYPQFGFAETYEKLGSVAPYVMAEARV
ncbi:Salicylate synthase [Cladobotryum mycophilum]|uniref:Salicylate synthase n=1 Tax=Cladobotryum mycophilum TaxID=491253 RepID=A0ABR0SL85_9HYPO